MFSQFIVYGNQDHFLEKIRLGKDRECRLLFFEEMLYGILVYKTQPSFTFEAFGVVNALEIKTLILVRKSAKFSGLMLKALYREAGYSAIKIGANCLVGTIFHQSYQKLLGLQRDWNLWILPRRKALT